MNNIFIPGNCPIGGFPLTELNNENDTDSKNVTKRDPFLLYSKLKKNKQKSCLYIPFKWALSRAHYHPQPKKVHLTIRLL
uniref:Uncharacterized protein n=1 Tax=Pyxicephalus adspersus TaxID=30357 RepID=A0AAV2ZPR7_PYXAD|nr:TPA: hypothetical protein GDO54_003815 [Pyxicephalus adspersus]